MEESKNNSIASNEIIYNNDSDRIVINDNEQYNIYNNSSTDIIPKSNEIIDESSINSCCGADEPVVNTKEEDETSRSFSNKNYADSLKQFPIPCELSSNGSTPIFNTFNQNNTNTISSANSIIQIANYAQQITPVRSPTVSSLLQRITLSWVFGLTCMVILMLFNPIYPMHFIWGILTVGGCMTSMFALVWTSVLLNYKITFLIFFSTSVYWIGTPVCWYILFQSNLYPPPLGVVTCVFPFEAVMLLMIFLLLPKSVRNPGNKKKILAAYTSLTAPYLSFMSGMLYFRLFKFSTSNIGLMTLPPAFTLIMKIIQLGLDLICIRCSQNSSNLFIILGRIVASFYSFAVLSYTTNHMALVSVLTSKAVLHLLLSFFLVFPHVRKRIIRMLPQKVVGWKKRFEKEVASQDLRTKEKESRAIGMNSSSNSLTGEDSTPGKDKSKSNEYDDMENIENEFDKMAAENDKKYNSLHRHATSMFFSMFSDIMALVMILSVYPFGRYGPSKEHYNEMFPFDSFQSDSEKMFWDFVQRIAICFVVLTVTYTIIWVALMKIIKDLSFKKILALVSVNWYPMKHFYVMSINIMMAYVIVTVTLMPMLYFLPNFNLLGYKSYDTY